MKAGSQNLLGDSLKTIIKVGIMSQSIETTTPQTLGKTGEINI